LIGGLAERSEVRQSWLRAPQPDTKTPPWLTPGGVLLFQIAVSAREESPAQQSARESWHDQQSDGKRNFTPTLKAFPIFG
jgi:hypothetical protein